MEVDWHLLTRRQTAVSASSVNETDCLGKNSDYKTTATAARQAQSQAPQKAAWPTKVKVTLGILFGILVAALILRLAVPSLQDNPLLNNLTTLLLGISCGALYFIRKDYPAPKASKLDGVVNAVLIVFALFYGVMGVWGLIRMVG